MLFLVIERFKPGALREVYRQVEEKGRLLPEGVTYVSSWLDPELTTCYQVMEAADRAGIEHWASQWQDLVEFEIMTVITSEEAKKRVLQD